MRRFAFRDARCYAISTRRARRGGAYVPATSWEGTSMLGGLIAIFRDGTGNLRSKIAGMYGVLVGFNILAWVLALAASVQLRDPKFLGIGLVAYGLGLRHAVDAHHIAAIVNLPCKLFLDGIAPAPVVPSFSLGDS